MLQQIRGYRQIKDLSIKNLQIATDAEIDTSKLKDGEEFIKRDGTVLMTNDLNLNDNNITGVSDPTNNKDAVNKSYVDSSFLQPSVMIRKDTTIEVPDGSRTLFHIAHIPVTNSEEIFLNGVLIDVGIAADYTIDDNAITFNIPPQTSDKIRINYIASS